jgi:glycosyltransferase involved in cell wall biosynthesis
MKNIHAVILHSERERDYKLCTAPFFKEKAVIIPNGIWLDEFDNNHKTRQDLDPRIANKRWLVNVSNFFPGKGQEHLIKIFSQLPEMDQTAYIQICSDIDFDVGKTLEDKWKFRSRKLKEKGMTVSLKKNLPREDVIGFLKQSNVFTFSSEKEVAPLVLLEAMASSLPWVSINVGNAEDLSGGTCVHALKDSRFHSMFDKRVGIHFREAVVNMWNNNSIGAAGRQHIEKNLTWDKILPQYLSVIES